MSILNQLFPASFRGISFYVSESNMDSGRKQVTHEFPNSNRRYVEDLGRFQNIYKITAIITGNSFDYIRRRDDLIQALNQSGTGLLVHPWYGSVEVVPKQFTVNESIARAGEAVFNLTFERAQTSLIPLSNTTTLARVSLFATNALNGFAFDIGNNFSLLGGYPNNFTDAQDVLSAIFNIFTLNTSKYTQVSSSINDYSVLLDDYETNQNSLILDPEEMGTSTIGLFTGIDDLIAAPVDRLNVYSQFYDFYDDIPPVPPTTFERIQRQANRDLLVGTIQGGSLVQSYNAAALATYGNVRELNLVQSQLEGQYQKIMDDDRITDNTKYLIQSLRNEARLFFESEKLNVNDIVTIETNRQPLTTLAYQYYGNTDNVPTLASLNSITNNAFVEGQLDILSE